MPFCTAEAARLGVLLIASAAHFLTATIDTGVGLSFVAVRTDIVAGLAFVFSAFARVDCAVFADQSR